MNSVWYDPGESRTRIKKIWIVAGVAAIIIAFDLIFLVVGVATAFRSNGNIHPAFATPASGSHSVMTAALFR